MWPARDGQGYVMGKYECTCKQKDIGLAFSWITWRVIIWPERKGEYIIIWKVGRATAKGELISLFHYDIYEYEYPVEATYKKKNVQDMTIHTFTLLLF